MVYINTDYQTYAHLSVPVTISSLEKYRSKFHFFIFSLGPRSR